MALSFAVMPFLLMCFWKASDLPDQHQYALPKVDVLLSTGLSIVKALQTAIYSTVKAAKRPERLRLHIAIAPMEVDSFRTALGISPGQTKRELPGGAELQLHMLNIVELESLYPKVGGLRADCPSNYARFFIDSYLPSDADRAIWLDADVVVQSDVCELADEVMQHPSKTIAFARYPGTRHGFEGVYSISNGLANLSWAKANIDATVLNHAEWNVGVLGFNMKHMREHALRDRALEWIHQNKVKGGSQTALCLAALVHPLEQEDPFFEVESTWNCFWGFVGPLRLKSDEAIRECKILHFADKYKPWKVDSSEALYSLGMVAIDRWRSAENDSRYFFT